jgi:hypothetical protein
MDKALDRAAVGLCAVWIFILLSSGIIEREVLVLHCFQSMIYGAAIVLILRGSKWGYGIAASMAFIWDFANLHTGFIFSAGFREWGAFLRGRGIAHFVPWEATVGWFAHLLLIAIVLLRWTLRPDKRGRDAAGLLAAFVATYTTFGIMLFFFGRTWLPRYLALFVR